MQSSTSSNSKLTLAGGLLAGIGASACCVGPFLLVSLGIGGAWIGHLTALEPVRPIFIALTVLFLGQAFRKLYLVPQRCSTDEMCVADRTRRTQRMVFWIFLIVSIGLVASPWIMPIFYR